MTQPFDPGLQPERTALAWRRSCLALLAGSLLAARILPHVFGPWFAIAGLLGVAFSAALLATAHRRYRRHHCALNTHGDRYPLASGRVIAALSTFGFAAALISAATVVITILAGS